MIAKGKPMTERPELRKRAANFVPLTPVSFLARAAEFFGDRIAIIHGAQRFTYRQFYARARQLAHALTKAGIKRGDTVAILAANTPAMLEAHYAAPMIGAVLNPINIRLDAPLIAFCLEHGEAKLLLADREFHATIAPALEMLGPKRPIVIDIADAETAGAPQVRQRRVRGLHRLGRPDVRLCRPRGRVGLDLPALHLRHDRQPQGRGLQPSRRLSRRTRQRADLQARPREPVSLDAADVPLLGLDLHLGRHGGRRHACVPAQGRAEAHLRCDRRASRHPHVRGADRAQHAGACAGRRQAALPLRTKVATGGAAPPAIVIERMEAMGFEVLHLYGTTESYGPSTYCAPMSEWQALPAGERYARMARQGIPNPAHRADDGRGPQDLEPLPKDGATIGEMMLTGNTLMKGYLKNEAATEEAFAGGSYHSGDLAVWHGDGSIEVKDRSKDIIISGREHLLP